MIDHISRTIIWDKFDENDFIYRSSLNGKTLYVRLNDFPEEQMYTLFLEENPLIDFDDWPQFWKRPSK